MKELEELEKQLRSWVPRRPSAKLSRRLFARPAVAMAAADAVSTGDDRPVSFRFSWLAPATAALFLLGLIVNQRSGPFLTVTSGSAPLVALAMSNQSAAAWLPGSFSREQNGLPRETFEWTNGGHLNSSIGSLPGARGTN